MLVLTRKKEEKIQIGKDITITILKVKGRSVQIGIEAPGEVRILRGEFVGKAQTDAAGEASDGPANRPSSGLARETDPEAGDCGGPGPKPPEVNIGTRPNDSVSRRRHSFPPRSAARGDRLGSLRADEFLPRRLRLAWPRSLG